MRNKKFLIQFEFPPETRWLLDRDNEPLAGTMRQVCENIASAFTTGPRPAVTVTMEEQPAPAPGLAHIRD